jgi:predicted secreted hydrolase
MLALLLLALPACSSGGEASACGETPTGAVKLPADDAAHGAPVEWWYWTGHLETQDGRWFGFEQVFFALVDQGAKFQMAQSALTDVSGAAFRHSVALGSAPAQVTDGFDLSVNGQTGKGGNGNDTLHVVPEDATIDLALTSVKAPVLHYKTGYTTYPDGNTYYYSRELSNATGTLALGGSTLPVTGQAWFDHQWGDLSQVVSQGWVWMAIQLDDHRDIMLNQPLQNGTPGPAVGTLSDADCHDTSIGPNDVQITSLGTWTSPHTSCAYPLGWHVVYGDIDVTITPVLQDQELYQSSPVYWEGASTVSGSATGRAYVELNGFCN